ncbi:MAG: LamG domain-containing protein [bacterium]|nr:LamG domain-containing protein [bacterium]
MKYKLPIIFSLILLIIFFVSFQYFITIPQNILGADNPGTSIKGYWPLEEGTGSTTLDYSGNGNTGTLTNFSNPGTDGWTTNGKKGNAVIFDGVNDYVAVTDPGTGSVLDFSNGSSITITAWTNLYNSATTTGRFPYIVSKGRTLTSVATNQNYGLRLNDVTATTADVNFLYRNSANTAWNRWASTAVLTKNSGWHHVAFVYTFGTAGSAVAYIDGVLSGGTWNLGTGADVPLQDNDALWIGSSLNTATNANFIGLLDEVRIYNRVLSLSEIQTLFGRTSRGHGVSR